MIRLNARPLVVGLALILAAAAVSAAALASNGGVRRDDGGEGVVEAFSLKGAVSASTAPVHDGEPPADQEVATERDDLLARWDVLTNKRERLLEELQAVHGEMGDIARQLWAYEMQEARERIREQLNRYGADYGEEIAEWLPPRLLEHISEVTGWTPDELRGMVRDGAWGDLL